MMTSSASRIRTLTELEGFLGKYLAGAPPVAANSILADAPPAPMYARLTFTGATGFDVGSEP